MKIRRNKINRGLVLGAVLLIGLICFIVISEVRFSSEKPLIADRVQNYIKELAELSVSDDGTAVGHKLTEEQKSGRMKKFDALAEKYWLGNVKESDITGTSLEKAREQYEQEWLNGIMHEVYTSADVPQNEVKVTSDGPDRAKAEVSLAGIVMEFTGLKEGSDHTPFLHSGRYVWDEPEEGDYLTDSFRGVYNGDMEFELERSGGEWNIISVKSYVWTSSLIKKGEQTNE